MNHTDLKDHSPPCDSEVSVDYYVTTVNNCSSQNVKDSSIESSSVAQEITVVVSIDQDSGVIKLRKRKKSKRRKKKTRSAIQESELHASDDGILYRSSSSDSSERKMPRRSISLCDRYVRKPSTSESFNKILSDRKRNFSKLSKRVPESRIDNENSLLDGAERPLESVEKEKSAYTHESSVTTAGKEKVQSLKEQDSALFANSTENLPGANSKKLNRDDALATLNAFMLDVQEATSVAKQQEDEKKKDSPLSESHSVNDLHPEPIQEVVSDPVDLPLAPDSTSGTSPSSGNQRPELHQSESVGGMSVLSETVFLSEPETSLKGDQGATGEQGSETPKSSAENSSCKEKMLLEMMLLEKVGNPRINGLTSQGSSSNLEAKERNTDYGLTHLEQVCKLIEQIGDLRKQNQALVQQVQLLESEVRILKREKGTSISDYSIPETYQTLNFPKRTRAVGRLKEAIAKSSRKISSDKAEGKKTQHFLSSANDSDRLSLGSSVPTSGYLRMAKLKQMSRSYMDLNAVNRQRRYSHDDIEVDIKGVNWRFWKSPTRSVDRFPPKRQAPAPKYQPPEKSNSAVNRAYLTVESLLNNNDGHEKVTSQNQSNMKPLRTSSRASDISGEMFGRSIQSHTSAKPPKYDENLRQKNQHLTTETPVHKPSFREKLTQWEKNAARKFYKRSNSVDRVGQNGNGIEHLSMKPKNLSSVDIYKSMPCVASGPDENSYPKKHSIVSMSSNEWNSLQETFPTKQTNGKPLNGFRNALRSRLPSPLRRKSSSNRKTWSFAKRKSGYYLPNAGEFSFGSSFELAESIGEQLTLDLDHDTIKDVAKADPSTEESGFKYTQKPVQPIRETLNDTSNQQWNDSSQQPQEHKFRRCIRAYEKKIGGVRPDSALYRLRKESNFSDENDLRRARCPFFPPIKPRKSATPIFV